MMKPVLLTPALLLQPCRQRMRLISATTTEEKRWAFYQDQWNWSLF